jgi:predicted DNA-binding ribbon-helix-helix protein
MDHPEERRCVELDGRKACVSLENDFWDCIEQIAVQRGTTLDHLVAQVVGDTAKDDLSAVLRVFILEGNRGGAKHDAVRTRRERSTITGSKATCRVLEFYQKQSAN